MTRVAGMLLVLVVLTGCRGQLQWVEEVAVVNCPGGRVDIEKRTTNVVGGQTRNAVVRTNACLN